MPLRRTRDVCFNSNTVGWRTSACYRAVKSMAAELWNRVNIPFPSAVSSVRVHFRQITGTVQSSGAMKLNILTLCLRLNLLLCAVCTPRGRERIHPQQCSFSPLSPVFQSCCRCCFADVSVKTLLVENERVLRLLRSEILQTEVRVLYELLYILNNSFRGNKTYKGLQQVRTTGWV